MNAHREASVANRAVLGTFDGFHAGHRALFFHALSLSEHDGMPVISVVIDRSVGERLCTKAERDALIKEAGAVSVITLDLEEIKELSPEQFVTLLRREYQVGACVCGYNFRFGKGRVGDADLLSSLLPTFVLPEQRVEGEPVSSTRIRSLLGEGDVRGAARLLMRPYSVSAVVEHGKKLGRRMGFPTANISFPPDALVPRRGVYFTVVTTQHSRYFAISNVGVRPTVDGEGVNLESYLLDFHGDLYGRPITVEFLEYLREERRFDGVAALEAQLEKDVEAGRRLSQKYS